MSSTVRQVLAAERPIRQAAARDVPLYLLSNGAFGIGKTTVARELRRHLPGAAIFDPEWVGFVLERLPGYARSDFQHRASWRRLSIIGAKSVGAVRRTVIVPMAFSEPRYLEEVRCSLQSSRRPVLHFCLTAPLETVQARLAMRGEPAHDPAWAWVHRRAAECCITHEGPEFAIHVPTEHSYPEDVAADLAQRIGATAQQISAADRPIRWAAILEITDETNREVTVAANRIHRPHRHSRSRSRRGQAVLRRSHACPRAPTMVQDEP